MIERWISILLEANSHVAMAVITLAALVVGFPFMVMEDMLHEWLAWSKRRG